jgi:DNA gyrase subunit B
MEKCELYLVEGNSAGGSAEGGRIREFQAILPLRGKVINAYKAREVKVLSNEEVKSMITALGCGIGDEVDLTKRRYGKVVIMTDADVDGSHIRTLLLTFFYRQMYRLVQAGCVYAALPPLYKVRKKGSKNAAPRYVQTDEEMRRELLESGIAGAIFDPQDGRQIEGATLDRLCKTLSQIEDSILALERRGISLREHAARQDKTTARLPYYHVFWKNQEHWFLTRRELDEFVSRIESETGSSLEKPVGHDSLDAALTGRDQPPSEGGEDRDLHITELHEVRSLNRQLVDLREIGFEIDALIPEKRTGLEGSRYYLRKGDTETGIDDLRGLLTAIRQSGEKGFLITRFKGLGEMDPEELRETTLDPKNRSLVQITMEDASAADDIFRILMGDRVEPRREFIEQNALEVRNLDV